ncbi:hypothetical protein EJ110_NYTH59513 [Nymphaea thermarum]|nr:hypothetical protein EJ110_NYTH59513 [Nymphaea thermarum]
MAAFSSSTISTDQTEIGAYRIENVLVQVTTIRLTKENYLKWYAAITMGIAGRGRIAYVNGSKVEPVAKKKKNSRARSSGGKKPGSNAMNPSDGKVSISTEQIRELRAYLSQIDVGQADTSDEVKVNQALAVSGKKKD